MEDRELEEMRKIMWDGYADVECTECGYCSRVEPDADYECPECEEGRLVSPLIVRGLI